MLFTHVCSWPEVRRGGERYLHELAAALHRRGHDVAILTTAPEASRDEQLGVPVLRLHRRHLPPRRNGLLDAEAAFGLQSFANALRWRPDVWQAFGTADAAAAAALGRLRPRLATAYLDLGIPVRVSRERRPDRRLHRAVVRGIGEYECLSTVAQEALQTDYHRSGPITPGGVRLEDFPIGTEREERPTVLFVGSVDEPRKRVTELLETAVRARRRVPDLQVWLSGPGDMTAAIAAVPGAAEIVTSALLDDRDALVERYRRSWLTVHPATHEAFGLVLVESLACGTPVIARGDTGPRDIVTAETGILIGDEPWDDALVRGLELVHEPGLPEACRDRATAFDWDTAIAPMFEEVYARASRR